MEEEKEKTKQMQENPQTEKQDEERIVRILSKDIEGNKTVYSGLTKIKGISWSLSNAICHKLGINEIKKIGELTQEEIKEITDFAKSPQTPDFLLNRRKDLETGEKKHLLGSDLDLRKDFDIKRQKKIKCYKGSRHSSNLPVNGQRTKGNFRKNKKKGVGIKKKK